VAALFLQANPTAPPAVVRDALFGATTRDVVVDARSTADHLLFSGVAGDDGGGPNQGPTAAIGANCTGLTCAFTDQSTDGDGWVAARSWSFGDGGTSSATNPSHAYAAAGTYTVTLTVTDNDGASASASRTVTVTQPPTPTITLSASWSRLFIYYFVTLQWSGATTPSVDVYLNGSFFRSTPNSGSFTAYTTSRGTFRWRVCNAGTTVCSNEAVTSF
jgi:PKD repeat protein